MLQSCGEGKERIHYWYSRGCNSGVKNFAEFRTMNLIQVQMDNQRLIL